MPWHATRRLDGPDPSHLRQVLFRRDGRPAKRGKASTGSSEAPPIDILDGLRQGLARTGVALSLVAAAGCGAELHTGTSPAQLVVDRLEAASGTGSTFATVLRSDVQSAGAPQPDRGRVVLRVRLRDPGTAVAPTEPSPMNVVTVTRYRVAFRRSDGRRVEGRDVPYAVDGAVTVAVGESDTPIEFTLVRTQAKLEAPLRPLAAAEGAAVLSMSADVSFYGRDARGRDVTATASLTVHFADWADS